MSYVIIAIRLLIGIRGMSEDHGIRFYWWNPIAIILVIIGALISLLLGHNPFKVFRNAFKKSDLWNGI